MDSRKSKSEKYISALSEAGFSGYQVSIARDLIERVQAQGGLSWTGNVSREVRRDGVITTFPFLLINAVTSKEDFVILRIEHDSLSVGGGVESQPLAATDERRAIDTVLHLLGLVPVDGFDL